jgi:hypothetical protein
MCACASSGSRGDATGGRRGVGEKPLPDSVSEHVLTHVAAHGIEQIDRSRVETAYLLTADDPAVDVALFDEQRVAPHMSALEREQLLGDPQPLVGNQGHHRRRIQLPAREIQPGWPRPQLAPDKARRALAWPGAF